MLLSALLEGTALVDESQVTAGELREGIGESDSSSDSAHPPD
jgi:hypothetical protein